MSLFLTQTARTIEHVFFKHEPFKQYNYTRLKVKTIAKPSRARSWKLHVIRFDHLMKSFQGKNLSYQSMIVNIESDYKNNNPM